MPASGGGGSGPATVQLATAEDVDAMQRVGIDAGMQFRAIDDPRIARCADDPPFTIDELTAAVADSRAWVAIDGGEVVGFAIAVEVDGNAHVEEVSVLPAFGGRGLGTALLEAVVAWAAAAGQEAVTLTTFRDVPWNRPFYEHRGFGVLEPEKWSPGLGALVAQEDAAGLDASLRVVMRRAVGEIERGR